MKTIQPSHGNARTSEQEYLLAHSVNNIAISDNLDNPDTAHHAEEVIQAKPKRKWQSYIWDTLDKSPEERRFLFKLDSAVLTFATLGYFIKSVKPMKELIIEPSGFYEVV